MATTNCIAKITSKGQVTIPSEVRQVLGVEAGDRIEFLPDAKGGYRIRARKRRSILDIARENQIEPEAPIGDIDEYINAAVDEAMTAKEQRSKGR